MSRTCSVVFKYNSTVCENLDDYPDVQDTVQKKVSDYQAYGTYFDLISTFAALYIGAFVVQLFSSIMNFCSLIIPQIQVLSVLPHYIQDHGLTSAGSRSSSCHSSGTSSPELFPYSSSTTRPGAQFNTLEKHIENHHTNHHDLAVKKLQKI